jgi:ribosomal-protein-alanine N-acetyltransferase
MMDHIYSDRLVLRNFALKDAPDLFVYLHSPRADCFLDLKLDNIAHAQPETEKRVANDEYIAVCLKDTDRLIGDLFCMFEKPDTYSIGWNFNAAYGGSGYAFEAAQALVRHLFSVKQARRIYAYVEDDNLPSRRLCDKLGMRQEGLFKEYVSFKSTDDGVPIYVNTMQYAILRKEWET